MLPHLCGFSLLNLVQLVPLHQYEAVVHCVQAATFYSLYLLFSCRGKLVFISLMAVLAFLNVWSTDFVPSIFICYQRQNSQHRLDDCDGAAVFSVHRLCPIHLYLWAKANQPALTWCCCCIIFSPHTLSHPSLFVSKGKTALTWWLWWCCCIFSPLT